MGEVTYDYDFFEDPYIAQWWYCTECGAHIRINKVREHMAKTGHREDYLRDTFCDVLLPEIFEPSWEDKSDQRKAYETILKKTAQNLQLIGQHYSMMQLRNFLEERDCIIIGAGPSLKANDHLGLLVDYQNSYTPRDFIVTDRSLIPALEAGLDPKLNNIFVNTLDDKQEIVTKFYTHDLIRENWEHIKFLFATNVDPSLPTAIDMLGADIHWYHPMRDYNNGEVSIDKILRLMFTAVGSEPLPIISDTGNVGGCSWMLAHSVMNAKRTILIGMDMEIKNDKKYTEEEKDNFKKQSDQFSYYRVAFYYHLNRYRYNTINCTEGGALQDPLLKSMKFQEYLDSS